MASIFAFLGKIWMGLSQATKSIPLLIEILRFAWAFYRAQEKAKLKAEVMKEIRKEVRYAFDHQDDTRIKLMLRRAELSNSS